MSKQIKINFQKWVHPEADALQINIDELTEHSKTVRDIDFIKNDSVDQFTDHAVDIRKIEFLKKRLSELSGKFHIK